MNTKDRIGRVLLDLQRTGNDPGSLRELGLLVEAVAVTPAGKRRLVRIWLDRDLAGVSSDDESSLIEPLSLDEVADATRIISAALDASGALGDAPYVLEIGSAGVDRPLTTPRHFRRNVSRLVEITLNDGASGVVMPKNGSDGSVKGRLIAAGPTEATLILVSVKDEPQTQVRIPYADIARAHVQVEFARVAAARVTTEEEN